MPPTFQPNLWCIMNKLQKLFEPMDNFRYTFKCVMNVLYSYYVVCHHSEMKEKCMCRLLIYSQIKLYIMAGRLNC